MIVLHSADWHYRDRDHDEIEKCIDFMIETALIEKPSLIIQSGDITDSQNLKLDSQSARTICRQFKALADIAPVVTILGTPSHDGKSAEILKYVQGKHQIHVSEKPEQLCLKAGKLYTVNPGDSIPNNVEAIITQIPTPTKQFFQADSAIEEGDKAISDAMSSILGAFGSEAQRFNCPHIVNGHFQVGGAFISETQQLIGRDIEISVDQLAMAEADLICLGHIHKAQIFERVKAFYSGSIYRKNYGETEYKGFYLHEFDDEGLGLSHFIKTPTRKLLTIREDATIKDVDVIERTVLSYDPEELKNAFLKVELKVWQDEASRINQAELERFFLESGAQRADISLIRIPRETVRASRVLQVETLREKILAMAEIRMEQVSDEVLSKADMLETMTSEELVQVVGRVN